MAKQAFFFIETQFDNLGDALINRELIKLMAKHSDVTLGLSKVPDDFYEMIGRDVLAAHIKDRTSGRSLFLLKVLQRALRGESCFVFLSPGGWIGELDGRLNLRSWLHTALYYLLSFVGVRVCQLGVSYEDLGPKLKLLLWGRSGAMFRHFARDEGSRREAERAGVRIDGLCPDLAFHAFASDSRGDGAQGITFSFRADQYPEQMDDIKALVRSCLSGLDDNLPVHFVAQVKKDRQANKDLAQWAQEYCGRMASYDDGSSRIQDAENFYRRSRVVVSNRLHSLLLAGSVGNAMIAAPISEHNKKIRALFSDVGLGKHVVMQGQTLSSAAFLELADKPFTAQKEKTAIEDCFTSIFGGRA